MPLQLSAAGAFCIPAVVLVSVVVLLLDAARSTVLGQVSLMSVYVCRHDRPRCTIAVSFVADLFSLSPLLPSGFRLQLIENISIITSNS